MTYDGIHLFLCAWMSLFISHYPSYVYLAPAKKGIHALIPTPLVVLFPALKLVQLYVIHIELMATAISPYILSLRGRCHAYLQRLTLHPYVEINESKLILVLRGRFSIKLLAKKSFLFTGSLLTIATVPML
jgi:hypothetical protein